MLDTMLVEHASAFRRKPEVEYGAAAGRSTGRAAARRPPLGLTSMAPVPEKQEPKVHGVNAQREDRRRPQVGGARGKRSVG